TERSAAGVSRAESVPQHGTGAGTTPRCLLTASIHCLPGGEHEMRPCGPRNTRVTQFSPDGAGDARIAMPLRSILTTSCRYLGAGKISRATFCPHAQNAIFRR